jgi:hypothetical protein
LASPGGWERSRRRAPEPTFSPLERLQRHLWTQNLEVLEAKFPFTMEVPYAVHPPRRFAAHVHAGSVRCESHRHVATARRRPSRFQPAAPLRHDELCDSGTQRLRVGQLTLVVCLVTTVKMTRGSCSRSSSGIRHRSSIQAQARFTTEVPYAVAQPCRAATRGRDGSVQCEPHRHFATAWFRPGRVQSSRNTSVRYDEHRDTGGKWIRVGQLTGRVGGRFGRPPAIQADASPSSGTTS